MSKKHEPVVTNYEVRPPTYPDGHWMNRFWGPLARGLLAVAGKFPFYRHILRAHPDARALLDDGEPVLFACTHQDTFDCFNGLPGLVERPLAAMVSYSRDGDLSSLALRVRGYEIVRGSSSRGGGEALMLLGTTMASGSSVLMVADGPKAPLGDVKPGVVRLAGATGAPIIPLRGWGLAQIRFHKSWSKAAVTIPFCPVVIAMGEPIRVPEDTRETRPYQLELAKSLADLAARTSEWAGGPKTSPFALART